MGKCYEVRGEVMVGPRVKMTDLALVDDEE
jgi:hypothetical protein